MFEIENKYKIPEQNGITPEFPIGYLWISTLKDKEKANKKNSTPYAGFIGYCAGEQIGKWVTDDIEDAIQILDTSGPHNIHVILAVGGILYDFNSVLQSDGSLTYSTARKEFDIGNTQIIDKELNPGWERDYEHLSVHQSIYMDAIDNATKKKGGKWNKHFIAPQKVQVKSSNDKTAENVDIYQKDRKQTIDKNASSITLHYQTWHTIFSSPEDKANLTKLIAREIVAYRQGKEVSKGQDYAAIHSDLSIQINRLEEHHIISSQCELSALPDFTVQDLKFLCALLRIQYSDFEAALAQQTKKVILPEQEATFADDSNSTDDKNKDAVQVILDRPITQKDAKRGFAETMLISFDNFARSRNGEVARGTAFNNKFKKTHSENAQKSLNCNILFTLVETAGLKLKSSPQHKMRYPQDTSAEGLSKVSRAVFGESLDHEAPSHSQLSDGRGRSGSDSSDTNSTSSDGSTASSNTTLSATSQPIKIPGVKDEKNVDVKEEHNVGNSSVTHSPPTPTSPIAITKTPFDPDDSDESEELIAAFYSNYVALAQAVTTEPVAALPILKLLYKSVAWYKFALENMLVKSDIMQKKRKTLITDFSAAATTILNNVSKIVPTENNEAVLKLVTTARNIFDRPCNDEKQFTVTNTLKHIDKIRVELINNTEAATVLDSFKEHQDLFQATQNAFLVLGSSFSSKQVTPAEKQQDKIDTIKQDKTDTLKQDKIDTLNSNLINTTDRLASVTTRFKK